MAAWITRGAADAGRAGSIGSLVVREGSGASYFLFKTRDDYRLLSRLCLIRRPGIEAPRPLPDRAVQHSSKCPHVYDCDPRRPRQSSVLHLFPTSSEIEFGVGGADMGFGQPEFAAHDIGPSDQ